MSKKRILLSALLVCVAILLNVLVCLYEPSEADASVRVDVRLASDKENDFELFYINGEMSLEDGFTQEKSSLVHYGDPGTEQLLCYNVLADTTYLRLDFGSGKSDTAVTSVDISYGKHTIALEPKDIEPIAAHAVKATEEGGTLLVEADTDDPYLVWDVTGKDLEGLVHDAKATEYVVLKVLVCLCIDAICLVILKFAKQLAVLPVELWHNRKLMFSLAKNDFKTKYAGSYLGIFWAFVQPIVTVLLYWFVFEKGLKATGVNSKSGLPVPFVLWLIAGLVPWFLFQDALNGATNALIEYSYLVKKVVFKISVLPIVKIVSAMFVNVFFMAFTIVLFAAYRYYPDLYTLQILYYTFAMLMLVLGLSYATCAIVVFFRDLTQIITIALQVGTWITPIMWNIDNMDLSPTLLALFKLNPMFYIVQGFRDSLINKVGVWEHPEMTMYFWIFTAFTFGLGSMIFKRLKVHFADVL